MRRSEGYHRRWRDWKPNQRQRAVLDLLVQGKTNAEIAETLGITVDGAKWHVGELLARTGCEDRQALATWWREARDQSGSFLSWLPRFRLLALSALCLAAVVTVVFLAMRPGGEPHPMDLQAAADFPTPELTLAPVSVDIVGLPPACDTPLPAGYRIVTADELRAEGLVEIGQVLEPRTCPLRVSNRVSRAVIWMADGGEIGLSKPGFHRVTSFGSYGGSDYPPSDVGFYYEGEQFRAAMWVEDNNLPVFVGQASTNIDVRVGQDYRIDLHRVGPAGAYVFVSLEGEISGDRTLALDSQGHLFIAPQPLPGEVVTNWLTGEEIDVGSLTRIGRLSLANGKPVRTDCWAEGGACSVYLDALGYSVGDYRSRPQIQAPVDGVLTCVPVESPAGRVTAFELDAGDYSLRVGSFGGYWGEPWKRGCEPRTVRAGEVLDVWTYTYVHAFAPGGTPLSIVANRDGDLFVGSVDLQFDCPCDFRN